MIPARLRRLVPRTPLIGVYLAAGLFGMAEGALRFLVPLNLDDRGQGAALVGVVMFVFSFMALLSRGLSAALFSPHRAARLILAAGLASTIAYVVTPLVTAPPLFPALMLLDGFGWGITTTCALAIVLLHAPSDTPAATYIGWYVGIQSLAKAAATTLGGVLAQAIGVQDAMLVLAGLPVVAAALIVISLPSADREAHDDDAAEADQPEGLPEAEIGPGWIDRADARFGAALAGLRRFVTMPAAVWAAAVVAIYLNVMNGLLGSFFPLLGLALGLSVAQIGTLSSTRSALSALSRFSAGWLLGQIQARRILPALLAVSAGTVAVLPSISSYVLLIPVFALNGLSRGLLRVTTVAAAMTVIRREQAGAAAAAMTAGLDVGRMAGPLIGGLVASLFGLPAMFRVVPLAFLALYLILYPLAGRRFGGRSPAAEVP